MKVTIIDRRPGSNTRFPCILIDEMLPMSKSFHDPSRFKRIMDAAAPLMVSRFREREPQIALYYIHTPPEQALVEGTPIVADSSLPVEALRSAAELQLARRITDFDFQVSLRLMSMYRILKVVLVVSSPEGAMLLEDVDKQRISDLGEQEGPALEPGDPPVVVEEEQEHAYA